MFYDSGYPVGSSISKEARCIESDYERLYAECNGHFNAVQKLKSALIEYVQMNHIRNFHNSATGSNPVAELLGHLELQKIKLSKEMMLLEKEIEKNVSSKDA